MIVGSKQAIFENEWSGKDAANIGMLLSMLGQMEGQYRIQMESAKFNEQELFKKTTKSIQESGGTISANTNTENPIN
jgi:hypothetical protein